jgi:hypothetical protein
MGDRENYVIHYLDGQAASEVLVVVGVKQTVPQNLFLVTLDVFLFTKQKEPYLINITN